MDIEETVLDMEGDNIPLYQEGSENENSDSDIGYESPIYMEKPKKSSRAKGEGRDKRHKQDTQQIKMILEGNKETNKKLDILADAMHGFQKGLQKIQKDLTKHKEAFKEYKEQDESRLSKIFREKLATYRTPDRENSKKKQREADLGLTEYLKKEKVPKNREDRDSSSESVSEVTSRNKKNIPLYKNETEFGGGKGRFRRYQTQSESDSESSSDEEGTESDGSVEEKTLSIKKGREESFSRSSIARPDKLNEAS